jgi:hypothetical protein
MLPAEAGAVSVKILEKCQDAPVETSALIFVCQIAPGDLPFARQWGLPTRERVNRLTISELMTPVDVPRNCRTLAGVFL